MLLDWAPCSEFEDGFADIVVWKKGMTVVVILHRYYKMWILDHLPVLMGTLLTEKVPRDTPHFCLCHRLVHVSMLCMHTT